MTTSTAEVKLPDGPNRVQKDYERSVAEAKPVSGYVQENYWVGSEPLIGARIAAAKRTLAEGGTARAPLFGNRLRWAAKTVRDARRQD